MSGLPETVYLAFPFSIGADGAQTADRAAHVRQQIEQVLFTAAGERVFRPEFGAGVRQLVFEPNASTLWEVTQRRLVSALAEVLQGEVDPRTLEVTAKGDGETLRIVVSYTLAAVGRAESHVFAAGG